MYNLADEGVQFSPTQLFNQTRRGCSASNGQGVQLGRYIQFSLAHRKEVRTSVKYMVIYRHKDKYSISKMCRFFEVSRSGYYDYVKKMDIPA